jgi:DNA-binding LytR/AlgR family response regulator
MNMKLEMISSSIKKRSRLIVSKGSEYYAIKTQDIALIYRNKLIVVVVDKEDRKYLYDDTLTKLEDELDNTVFFRVNRKFIVNINFIRSYKSIYKLKIEILLNPPVNHYEIIVSQDTAPYFKKWMEDPA